MVDALHTLYGKRVGLSSSGSLLVDGVAIPFVGSTGIQTFSGPVKATQFVETVDTSYSTVAATLSEGGLSVIGTTAATVTSWTMPAPTRTGIHKYIRLAYASTAGSHIVSVSTGNFIGTTLAAQLGLGTLNQSVHLIAESTKFWGLYGQGTSVPAVPQ